MAAQRPASLSLSSAGGPLRGPVKGAGQECPAYCNGPGPVAGRHPVCDGETTSDNPATPCGEQYTMNPRRWACRAVLLAAAFGGLTFLPTPAQTAGPTQAEWDAVADKAIAYLKSSQGDDGGWSTKQ